MNRYLPVVLASAALLGACVPESYPGGYPASGYGVAPTQGYYPPQRVYAQPQPTYVHTQPRPIYVTPPPARHVHDANRNGVPDYRERDRNRNGVPDYKERDRDRDGVPDNREGRWNRR